MTRHALLILLALLSSACAPQPVTSDNEPSAGDTVTPNRPPSSGATAVLVQQSRSQFADGRYPEAAATLERAVRIEPGNAWLWLELARVHLAAGDIRQSEAHAKRALSLAATDDQVRRAAQEFLDALPAQ